MLMTVFVPLRFISVTAGLLEMQFLY